MSTTTATILFQCSSFVFQVHLTILNLSSKISVHLFKSTSIYHYFSGLCVSKHESIQWHILLWTNRGLSCLWHRKQKVYCTQALHSIQFCKKFEPLKIMINHCAACFETEGKAVLGKPFSSGEKKQKTKQTKLRWLILYPPFSFWEWSKVQRSSWTMSLAW